MSIQSCYFCIQDVEKLWFWMCLRHVSMLCHFCLFFKAVFLVFLTAQWRLRHTGSSGFSPSLRLRFISENASLLCIFVSPPTVPLHYTKLLTRDLFFVPCHCSYISVPCPAFHVHVAGDLNKTISFAAGVLSTSFARALLRLIHWSPSCPIQLSIFKT